MNSSTQRWQQLKLDRYDPYLRQDSLLWLDFFHWGGKILAQSSIFEASDGSVDVLFSWDSQLKQSRYLHVITGDEMLLFESSLAFLRSHWHGCSIEMFSVWIKLIQTLIIQCTDKANMSQLLNKVWIVRLEMKMQQQAIMTVPVMLAFINVFTIWRDST